MNDQSEYKSASEIKELNYLSTVDIDIKKKKYLSKNVDRSESITKINELLLDIDAAIEIEAGIYEFALVYTNFKNIIYTLLPAIYNDKLNDIIKNITTSKFLKSSVDGRSLILQEIAFYSPQKLNPDNWHNLIKKNEYREYKKNNMGSTDLYRCNKCGNRKCSIVQLQTRSADESFTNYITCLVCYTTFKK